MSRRGVSIIEVLVVVALISILTAIAIPVLRAARISSKDAEDLSNLSQTMKDFGAYAAANRDRIVNAGLPGSPDSAWFYGTTNPEHARGFYLSQSTCWNRVLARWAGHFERHWHSAHEQFLIDYGNGDVVDPRQSNPEFPHLSLDTAYKMPTVMLTRADAWTNPPLRIPLDQFDREYFKVLAFGEVKHPASKGLLIHALRPGQPKLYHIALADGSVRMHDLNTGRPTAIPPWPGPMTPGKPVYATLHGYEGIDF